MFSRGRLPAVLALALIVGLSAPARAENDPGVVLPSPAVVTVHAMPLGSVSLDRPVMVRVFDDAPANQRLKVWVEKALKARGVRLGGAEAPLVLDIDTSAANAPARPPADTAPVLLRGQAGTGRGGEDAVAVGLRVFSNTQASVLGGVREAPVPAVAGPDIRVDLGLSDRVNGRRLWLGWATAKVEDLADGDRLLLVAAPLAAELGSATRGKSLTIPAGTLAAP